MPEIPETPIYAEIQDVIRLGKGTHYPLAYLTLDRSELLDLAASALWEARNRRPHFSDDSSLVLPGNE